MSKPSYEIQDLTYRTQNRITSITLNRPKTLNAINSQILKELISTLETLEKDNETKVVVFTGSGNKSFSVGADIAEMKSFIESSALSKFSEFISLGKKAFKCIESFSKPTIAAVNGYALGGGLELALACDLRLASTKAILGLTEVTLGMIPGWGGTQRLPRIIGLGKAKELILLGERIDAESALQIGLISKVFPEPEFEKKVYDVAMKLASRSLRAINAAKVSILEGWQSDTNESESEMVNLCFNTQETRDAIEEFYNARKARRKVRK